jgi:hypothetical protein
MNLVEIWIEKILSKEPVFKYNKFYIKILGNSYGQINEYEKGYNTLEEAKSVKPGDYFLG